MWVLAEMLEFYEIFRVLSKGPLQTMISTTMPAGSLDRTIRTGQGAEGNARVQAKGHVTSDAGKHRTRQEEDVSNPDRDKDDSCVEIHGNEGWMEDYERMSEATTWSGDASDKGISDNK